MWHKRQKIPLTVWMPNPSHPVLLGYSLFRIVHILLHGKNNELFVRPQSGLQSSKGKAIPIQPWTGFIDNRTGCLYPP